jgi:Domain of unknown function (DUF892)
MPKHLIAANSWEHFEVGSYRSVLGAAQELGMSDLEQMCERFIPEVEDMAKVFFDELPAVTRSYLREHAAASDRPFSQGGRWKRRRRRCSRLRVCSYTPVAGVTCLRGANILADPQQIPYRERDNQKSHNPSAILSSAASASVTPTATSAATAPASAYSQGGQKMITRL